MTMLRPTAPGEDELLLPGALIGGRFAVEALIGRGGAAAVYRVHDTRSGGRLALKLLTRAAAARGALLTSQFEREYYTLCQLAHPRIVTVYDWGVDDGAPFYTMELLDGEDLSVRRNLPWREVCAVLLDVASSLAIIHSRKLVHRDVSLRNVRCTSDGRAKLIDFGAMSPMGAVKQVIGTPPFVSPEALQLQGLDGRSDLYALGVLAYFMLTGYYPYHARSFAQLRVLWATPPYGPARYHRDLPAELDRLVMQLLELDRSARPASAAEVMERLSGIAGLPLAELPEVRKAYLATPMLIGREAVLGEVRAALLGAQEGHGACLLIEGAAGIGRSRVLDACVLEAKLQGRLLLRADAADSGDEYSLVQALCTQLLQHVPELCEQSAAPRRAWLGQVIAEFEEPGEPAVPSSDREKLQGALCDFISAIARARPLVIAIDDIDKVDESSATVLGGLADRARSLGLCLLLTVESDAAASPAVALIRRLSTALHLDALTTSQSEALLRSVFGDVANVAALSERIHRLTEGNPRGMMNAAEQLVEHGVARYEAGSWTLPAEIEPDVLPQYLAGTLQPRLDALAPDARELAEALALTEPALLNVSQYHALTSHADAGRVFEVLDTLVAAGILIAEGKHYRFKQQAMRELLRTTQDEQRVRRHHSRIARALSPGVNPLVRAYHRMLAGEEREALSQLLPLPELRTPPPTTAFAPELANRAVEAAERLGLPLVEQLAFRLWQVGIGLHLGQPEAVPKALALVEQYERDCGLADYRTLDESLPTEQRVVLAVLRARERFESQPAQARGLSPEQALMPLGLVCSCLVLFAAIAHDCELLDRLPVLDPFCARSPALDTVTRQIEMQRRILTGRPEGLLQLAKEVVASLERPDRGGFPSEIARTYRLGMVFVFGLFAAGAGQAKTRESVAELQREPGYRPNAWRVRMVYELMHGDQAAAMVCRRRAELSQLQDGGQPIYPGITVRIELSAAIYNDDLLAVKDLRERMEELAGRYPGYQPTLHLATSHYRRLQGDLSGALQELGPALATAAPGKHDDWTALRASEILLLTALGRAEHATELGLEAVAQCEQARHWVGYTDLLRNVAHAAVLAGRVPVALDMITRGLKMQERFGPRGLALGLSYEVRAEVALAMQDAEALQHYFDLCAQQFINQRDGSLMKKFERLKEQAEDAGLPLRMKARSPVVNAAEKRPAPRVATLIGESV